MRICIAKLTQTLLGLIFTLATGCADKQATVAECQSDVIDAKQTRLFGINYVENSDLKFVSNSNDPQMAFDLATTCSLVLVEFTIHSDSMSSLQAFFADEGQPFSEERSIFMQLGQGENKIHFELPPTTKRVRIDPIVSKGSFSIDTIRVSGATITKT